MIDAALTGTYTSLHHLAVSSPLSDSRVLMEADVRLAGSSVMTPWQFGGLNSTLTQFIGGFNVAVDGRLQIITAGFPYTAPIIARDVWNHYAVLYKFPSQTFDIYINGFLVAADKPFFTPQTVFARGDFATFDTPNGNDKGYIDNFQIGVVNAPPQRIP